jgi:hypothetical protein
MSIAGDDPSTKENSSRTHGRYGARKERTPRKFMTEHQHEEEIGCATAERVYLEHLAVAVEEEHVKEEVEVEVAKVEKVCDGPPHMTLLEDQIPVEVEFEGGDDLKSDSCSRDYGEADVRARDGRHLLPPFLEERHG